MRPDDSKSIEVWRVNAFTTTPFTGNPAGVVPQADGLSDRAMQSIARELNDISETAFVLPPRVEDADLRLRYFTSTTEVDLCGHATVAALFTLHWAGSLTGRNGLRTIRAETRVGVLELGLEFRNGRMEWAHMEQLEPEFAEAGGAHQAATVLGLPEDAIARRPAIACCRTGIWVCYVPVKDAGALSRVQPDRERIGDLSPGQPDFAGVYAFALEGECTTRGRFFPLPRFGIREDPVTGTASAGLAALLMRAGLLPPDGELRARQGIEMGRSGEVRVRRHPSGRMRIRGQAVPVFRGSLLQGVTPDP